MKSQIRINLKKLFLALILSIYFLVGQTFAQYTNQNYTTNSFCPYVFSKNLSQGANDSDVIVLQKILNADSRTQISVSGVASPGNETNYFGAATKDAVKRFQALFIEYIGIANGVFGPKTRTVMNAICNNDNSNQNSQGIYTTVTTQTTIENQQNNTTQTSSSTDKIPPAIYLRSNSTSVDQGNSFRIIVSASEPINRFEQDTIIVEGGYIGEIRKLGPNSYSVLVTPNDSAKIVILQVEAGKVFDLAGNTNENASNEIRILVNKVSVVATTTITTTTTNVSDFDFASIIDKITKSVATTQTTSPVASTTSSCTNGATNPPTCNNNVCTNGSVNFPACNDNYCISFQNNSNNNNNNYVYTGDPYYDNYYKNQQQNNNTNPYQNHPACIAYRNASGNNNSGNGGGGSGGNSGGGLGSLGSLLASLSKGGGLGNLFGNNTAKNPSTGQNAGQDQGTGGQNPNLPDVNGMKPTPKDPNNPSENSSGLPKGGEIVEVINCNFIVREGGEIADNKEIGRKFYVIKNTETGEKVKSLLSLKIENNSITPNIKNEYLQQINFQKETLKCCDQMKSGKCAKYNEKAKGEAYFPTDQICFTTNTNQEKNNCGKDINSSRSTSNSANNPATNNASQSDNSKTNPGQNNQNIDNLTKSLDDVNKQLCEQKFNNSWNPLVTLPNIKNGKYFPECSKYVICTTGAYSYCTLGSIKE